MKQGINERIYEKNKLLKSNVHLNNTTYEHYHVSSILNKQEINVKIFKNSERKKTLCPKTGAPGPRLRTVGVNSDRPILAAWPVRDRLERVRTAKTEARIGQSKIL